MKIADNKLAKFVLLATLIAAPTFGAPDDDGLILPMPGQKEINKASASVNIPKSSPAATLKPAQPTSTTSDILIPLPADIKPVKIKPAPDLTTKPEPTADKPLIQITPPAPPEEPSSGGDFPVPPDEITVSSGEDLGDLLPPAPPPEIAVASGSETPQTMPVFPKDTSSAIFMVMKTWQCDNYDGSTLLAHAVEVYGKESDDVFQIQGLSDPDGTFQISIEEEDITLDELLDILAMKSGRDWGVDIPSKTIYFYPKGVKIETYNVW